ncbi:uncharacterized protein BKA55DRAFT_692694 [Fusarium redolens]|uniref:Uncharacterized protein n=1 Tax=Fusarium redolens TaxID=48865 RepID=A0A9P9GQL9_FUSRE|nr:uncharacterized protein BKA55DRAFT_692694 [Fusarium redolens]KAH7243526.1 hypothetical protein BKA55DRAFT_692694 [Fusarium redolens]
MICPYFTSPTLKHLSSQFPEPSHHKHLFQTPSQKIPILQDAYSNKLGESKVWDHTYGGPPLSGPPLSRPPFPTKTPYSDKRPDHKDHRIKLKEEPSRKSHKLLMPHHSLVHGPAHGLPLATGSELRDGLGTADVSHITAQPLHPLQVTGKIDVESHQSESEASECASFVLVIVMIVLVAAIAAIGVLALFRRVIRNFSRRRGQRQVWNWVKKADGADLSNLLDHLKQNPHMFRPYHLNMLRDILASHEGPSYLPTYDKASGTGHLDSTDCATPSGPPPAHMAPSQPAPFTPGAPNYGYPPRPMRCPKRRMRAI